ncbi:MAG: GNAT family N-acetyltransferase [Verrucomicrobia bacterium]|nr:GNAT family N-acetyltransferase [Verrucomicrobiota bacterium]
MTASTVAIADETEHYVLPEHITKWKGDPYQGSISLSFLNASGVIRAQIETEDLLLVSITEAQLEDYVQLFADPAAVAKYSDGQPWTRDEVESAVQQWIARWEKLQDPFSAFAIFENNGQNNFIGHIVLGHGARYGQSELAFLFKPSVRNINYATQAVTAVLYGYAPQIFKDQYPVNLNNTIVDPSPLRSIHATGHFDDTFSGQAMIRSGMKIGENDIIWGAQRFHYLIRIDEIMNSYLLPDDSIYDSAD